MNKIKCYNKISDKLIYFKKAGSAGVYIISDQPTSVVVEGSLFGNSSFPWILDTLQEALA